MSDNAERGETIWTVDRRPLFGSRHAVERKEA